MKRLRVAALGAASCLKREGLYPGGEALMRRILVALLGAGALAVGGSLATPAAADPAPQACPGELVSFAVQLFDGRRAVADTFFGDYPRAVQDAQSFMKAFCGLPGS
jgi:hypothetical protein